MGKSLQRGCRQVRPNCRLIDIVTFLKDSVCYWLNYVPHQPKFIVEALSQYLNVTVFGP